MKDAGLGLAAAEQTLEVLHEQIAETEAAVARAQADYDAADQATKDHAVALAQRAVIASGDTLSQLGRDLATGAERHAENYQALFAAMRLACRAPSQTELDYLQSLQTRIPGCVPGAMQQRIVQRGSVVEVDIGTLERSIWYRGATPDPEGDAPHLAAATAAADRVIREQAFEAAGREQNARGASSRPAWSPTELITATGPRIREI
jgi:hypothetical protein